MVSLHIRSYYEENLRKEIIIGPNTAAESTGHWRLARMLHLACRSVTGRKEWGGPTP